MANFNKINVMKKIFTLFALAAMVILSACGGGKDAISKDGLQGRYQLEIGSLLEDVMAERGGNDLSSSFASMLFSQLEVTVQFETEKAIFDASGAASEILKNYTNGKVSLPMAVEYKIENDSILYLKPEGKEFEDVGVLKKLGDSYDYLKFISTKYERKVEVSLKKIKQ